MKKLILVPTFVVVEAEDDDRADEAMCRLQEIARQHGFSMYQDELLPNQVIANPDEFEPHSILNVMTDTELVVPYGVDPAASPHIVLSDALDKLKEAADNHGEDDDPDHTVGDLQDLLTTAWSLMTVSQILQLLTTDTVDDIITAGARGEFTADDLKALVLKALAQIEVVISSKGYEIAEVNGVFNWETSDDAGEDFWDRADAAVDAYRDYQAKLKQQ